MRTLRRGGWDSRFATVVARAVGSEARERKKRPDQEIGSLPGSEFFSGEALRSLAANGPKCVKAPEVERAVGDDRRGGNRFAHVVLGEQLERLARLGDGDHAVPGNTDDLAVDVDGTGTVPLSMGPFVVVLAAGPGIHADQVSVFPAEVDMVLVDHR